MQPMRQQVAPRYALNCASHATGVFSLASLFSQHGGDVKSGVRGDTKWEDTIQRHGHLSSLISSSRLQLLASRNFGC